MGEWYTLEEPLLYSHHIRVVRFTRIVIRFTRILIFL
jgi:hypothetical protein